MEINYIKLGITLFLALTLSSLLVDGIETYLASRVLLETSEQLEVQNQKNRLELVKQTQENERKIKDRIEVNRKKAVMVRKKAESLKSIRGTNNETCRFWTQQYDEAKSEYREQMKISACNRARND